MLHLASLANNSNKLKLVLLKQLNPDGHALAVRLVTQVSSVASVENLSQLLMLDGHALVVTLVTQVSSVENVENLSRLLVLDALSVDGSLLMVVHLSSVLSVVHNYNFFVSIFGIRGLLFFLESRSFFFAKIE